jgi:hypothetical protein
MMVWGAIELSSSCRHCNVLSLLQNLPMPQQEWGFRGGGRNGYVRTVEEQKRVVFLGSKTVYWVCSLGVGGSWTAGFRVVH